MKVSIQISLKRKRQLWAYLFISIPLLFFIFIRFLPMFSSFYISLHEWNIVSPQKPWVGLGNYGRLLKDPIFWKALKNTFTFVIAGVPLQLALGLLIALALQRVIRLKSLFKALYFAPYVTSMVAIAWIWRWMYLPQFGTFNTILSYLGLPQQPFLGSTSQAIYCMITAVVWKNLGFQIVVFLAGLEAIPSMYYEAAEIDGANSWDCFRYITIPLLNPTMVFLAVMGAIQMLQVFDVVLNMSYQGLGGPLDSTKTLVLTIYREGFAHFRMGLASAITVVLFSLIMVITVIQMKLLPRKIEY